MKIPQTFKIDLTRNKSCVAGGFNHSTLPVLDEHGFTVADRCRDCGHTTPRKKVKKVRVKGSIIL